MRLPSLLVLMRHGQSIRNQVKGASTYLPEDLQETLETALACSLPDHDVPLTQAGVDSVRRVGVALHSRYGEFDQVFCSPYVRTRQSPDAVLEAYDPAQRALMVQRTSDHLFLQERHVGYTVTMTAAQVDRAFPGFQEHAKLVGPMRVKPPGGEGHLDVLQRVSLFYHFVLRPRANNQRVLVLSHGDVMRAFRYHIEGWSAARFEQELSRVTANEALVVYARREDALVLQEEPESHAKTWW